MTACDGVSHQCRTTAAANADTSSCQLVLSTTTTTTTTHAARKSKPCSKHATGALAHVKQSNSTKHAYKGANHSH